MPSIPRACDAIAEIIGVRPPDAAQTYRRVSEHGLLPRTRGPVQPMCTPEHAALLVIALATETGRFIESDTRVREFAALPCATRGVSMNAGAAIAAVLANGAKDVDVEFQLEPFREVCIAEPGGRLTSFRRADLHGGGDARTICASVSSAALQAIARAINERRAA